MPIEGNIRTVNGRKHNATLPSKYWKIQNRAAAILDAWDEYGGPAMPLEVVAHLHKMSSVQINNDIYGDPLDIEKRFGMKNSQKLERVLRICLKEIKKGIEPTLVAVAHHVPYCLIRRTEDERDMKKLADEFLGDMSNRLTDIKRNQLGQHVQLIDRTVRTDNSPNFDPIQDSLRFLPQPNRHPVHHLFNPLRTVHLSITQSYVSTEVSFTCFYIYILFFGLIREYPAYQLHK